MFTDLGALSDDNPGGFVAEAALFALICANERRGIKTAFPHPAKLYRLLVSKLWTTKLCTYPQYSIPATTTIPRAAVVSNPEKAAAAALARLDASRTKKAAAAAAVSNDDDDGSAAKLDVAPVAANSSSDDSDEHTTGRETEKSKKKKKKKKRMKKEKTKKKKHKESKEMRGKEEEEESKTKKGVLATRVARRGDTEGAGVVVKLGYSWEAMDVRSVPNDPAAIGLAAQALLQQPGCSADEVLLQDRAPADVELRLFIVKGVVRYRYWARYDSCSSETGKFSKWTRKVRASILIIFVFMCLYKESKEDTH